MRRLRNQSVGQFLFPLDPISSQVFDGLLARLPDLLGLLLPFLGLFRFLALRGLVVLRRIFYRLESRCGELLVVCRIFGFLSCERSVI